MEYVDAINNNTLMIKLLVQQIGSHQKIFEQFITIMNNLTNVKVDMVIDDMQKTKKKEWEEKPN